MRAEKPEIGDVWAILDVELTYNYLGKSKVNIDDLFDVE